MEYGTSSLPVDGRFRSFIEGINLWNVYSQFCEDSIIDAIFKKIGTANKWCFECGAADGLFFSNTKRLIDDGWHAVLVEADRNSYMRMRERYLPLMGGGYNGAYGYSFSERLFVCEGKVVPLGECSIYSILAHAGAPLDIDLLSIDVDGQDYYLFNSLVRCQPRVVVVEYDPNAERMFIPELNGQGQAGLDAMRYVANARGYESVCATQTNLICVRRDLAHLLMDEQAGAVQPASTGNVKIAAVMSTPRLGFLSNSDCIYQALAPAGIPLSRGEGVFWDQALTRAIETVLKPDLDYILTIDYDSAFTHEDIAKLVCFLDDNPKIDVAVSIQQKREGGEVLAQTDGQVDLSAPGVPIRLGHFGLTLFRASVFERLPKPWFLAEADPTGSWNENRVDSDMYFWRNCHQSGISVYLALTVVIGHMEQVVTWTGKDLKPYYQTMNDWRKGKMRPPAEAFERVKQVAALEMGA